MTLHGLSRERDEPRVCCYNTNHLEAQIHHSVVGHLTWCLELSRRQIQKHHFSINLKIRPTIPGGIYFNNGTATNPTVTLLVVMIMEFFMILKIVKWAYLAGRKRGNNNRRSEM